MMSLDHRIREITNMGVLAGMIEARQKLGVDITTQFLDMVEERDSKLWDCFVAYKQTVPESFGFLHFVLSVVNPAMPG